MSWYVYIIRCSDDTLYTGITKHLKERLAAHNRGKGAKYTRGRCPVELLYWEECLCHAAALKRETEIKKLRREEKLLLCHEGESRI